MDIIPKDAGGPPEIVEDLLERYPGLDLHLSPEALQARRLYNGQSPKRRSALERWEILHAAAGGELRELFHIDKSEENYERFLNRGARLASTAAINIRTSGPTQIITALPRSPLDGDWEDVTPPPPIDAEEPLNVNSRPSSDEALRSERE